MGDFLQNQLAGAFWSTLTFVIEWAINTTYWVADIVSWQVLVAFAVGVVAQKLWPNITFGVVTFGAGLILAGKLKK